MAQTTRDPLRDVAVMTTAEFVATLPIDRFSGSTVGDVTVALHPKEIVDLIHAVLIVGQSARL